MRTEKRHHSWAQMADRRFGRADCGSATRLLHWRHRPLRSLPGGGPVEAADSGHIGFRLVGNRCWASVPGKSENGISEPDVRGRRYWRALEIAAGTKIDRPLVLRLVERCRGSRPDSPVSFYILQTKVWNGFYKAFADARPDKAGSEWQKGTWKTQSSRIAELLPVTNISGDRSVGILRVVPRNAVRESGSRSPVVRLPTKEEWDRAAAYDAWMASDHRLAERGGPHRVSQKTDHRFERGAIASGRQRCGKSTLVRARHGRKWPRMDRQLCVGQQPALVAGPARRIERPGSEQIELRGQSWMEKSALKYSEESGSVWKSGRQRPFEERGMEIGFRIVVEIPQVRGTAK